jgi:hypothetical protein
MTFIDRLREESSDPHEFKSITDLVAPYVAEILYHSFFDGQYASEYRQAFVTPIVKPGKHLTDIEVYQPITNLPVLLKLFERMHNCTTNLGTSAVN